MAPSPLQLLIIGLIILVLFGASRLGEVGKGLGDGIRNFKKGLSGDPEEDDAEAKQLQGDRKTEESTDERAADKVPEKKEKA
jgi:sec-independent protein translocase protein TatA